MRIKNKLSFFGTVLGVIGLSISVLHFFAGPFEKQPDFRESVASNIQSIKTIFSSKLDRTTSIKHTQKMNLNVDKILVISAIGSGLLAVILGGAAFVRREDLRMTSVSVLLGGMAIATQYMVVLLSLLALCIILLILDKVRILDFF